MSQALSERSGMSRFSDQFQEMMDGFFAMQCRYQSAIREVRAKLETLDEEFSMRYKRNPIHHMESRMKTLPSIIQKLERKSAPITIASAMEHLADIAGIRVVCSYLDDIYTIANLLTSQDDVTLIRSRDYILSPKENGYRSLHLVVEVPVFLSDGKQQVPVEVQIRTIAMDFWASLEHQLRYKENKNVPSDISDRLLSAAQDIAQLDKRMQEIYNDVEKLDPS